VLVEEAEAPFELLPLVVAGEEVPAAEVDPEIELVVPTAVVVPVMGTTAEALMQLLSELVWIVTDPDWASAPVLSRRLKKTPTPAVILAFHVKDVTFSGWKVTRALALGWPAGSTLKKYSGVPPVQLSKIGWH